VLSEDSTKEESFANNLLEYPQYTKPFEFEGTNVPEVLTSGDHKKVDEWRKEQSLIITYEKRRDLLNEEQIEEAKKLIENK
jgi:tRNA (guanine37-N1)-methyltransferase